MCRSKTDGGRRCSGHGRSLTEDETRYLERAAYVEAHPDVTELMTGEALGRGTEDAGDAAQRMLAERLGDFEQWEA
jgi:hypothetical protein